MYEAKAQKAEMKIQPSETERLTEDYWDPYGSPYAVGTQQHTPVGLLGNNTPSNGLSMNATNEHAYMCGVWFDLNHSLSLQLLVVTVSNISSTSLSA